MKVKRWNETEARQVRKKRQQLYAEQQERCYVCDRQVRVVDGVVAHDIPLSVPGAGRNERSNLRFLCGACNSARGRRNLLEFALDAVDHPPGHISRERLVWIIRHHRNPAYPKELVGRADAYGGGAATAGLCLMCAVRSDGVRPHKFSSNFTAFNEMVDGGDGLCGACADLITDRTSRQKSWIIEDGKRTIIDRSEWIPTILRDKKTPFIIYLTSTGRMQGFIPLMRRPNLNNVSFVLAHDRQMVRVVRKLVPGLLSTAEYLRERRWGKREMTGEPIADRYADEDAIRRWHEARTNPAWPVIVAGLAPPPKREGKQRGRPEPHADDHPTAAQQGRPVLEQPVGEPHADDHPTATTPAGGQAMSDEARADAELRRHLPVTMLAATWRRVDWKAMKRKDGSKADTFARCLYNASRKTSLAEAVNVLCERLGVGTPCSSGDTDEYFAAYERCMKHEDAVLDMLWNSYKMLAGMTAKRVYGSAGTAKGGEP